MDLLPIIFAPANGPNILDVGCYGGWNGAFFKLYPTIAFHVVGCDIDAKMLAKAKSFLDGVVRCDIRQLPFRNRTFQDALCIEVIEHLERIDIKPAIDEVMRVCEHAFVTTPNGWQGEGHRLLVESNPYQRHRSALRVQDLELMGAKKVRGLNWNIQFSNSVSSLLWFIPYFMPRYARNLMAYF